LSVHERSMTRCLSLHRCLVQGATMWLIKEQPHMSTRSIPRSQAEAQPACRLLEVFSYRLPGEKEASFALLDLLRRVHACTWSHVYINPNVMCFTHAAIFLRVPDCLGHIIPLISYCARLYFFFAIPASASWSGRLRRVASGDTLCFYRRPTIRW
jgi:hypothetical protein